MMNIVIIISLSLNIFLLVALCGQGCKNYRRGQRKCSSCPSRPAPVLSEVPPPSSVTTNIDTTETTALEDISVTIEEEKGERPKAATILRRGILKN